VSQLRPRDLAKAIAEVRDSHLREIWPNGSVPTIYTYGSLADATWSAWGSIDGRLRDALERPLPDYQPVSAFGASFSPDLQVYVATRRWVRDDQTLVTDVFTFSTGPKIQALVYSGQTAALIQNPYSRHINSFPSSLREPHHDDAATAAGSTRLPPELGLQIFDAVERVRRRTP
jgi:hypothetical protein